MEEAKGLGHVERRVAFDLPSAPGSLEVAEDWLSPYEKLPAAENIARLAGDRRIVEELTASGFGGVHYVYFATELAKYGIAVITGWIRKGVIFQRVAAKGFGHPMHPPDGAFDDEDAPGELANEVVAVALKYFREEVLIPGEWDPSRGASIKTYFIGQCLMRFSNVYKRWLGEVTREQSTTFEDDDLARHQPPATTDVATAVGVKIDGQRQLQRIADSRAREALVLYAAGHTQPEIAVRFGTTTKTIERLIANARSKLVKGKIV